MTLCVTRIQADRPASAAFCILEPPECLQNAREIAVCVGEIGLELDGAGVGGGGGGEIAGGAVDVAEVEMGAGVCRVSECVCNALECGCRRKYHLVGEAVLCRLARWEREDRWKGKEQG